MVWRMLRLVQFLKDLKVIWIKTILVSILIRLRSFYLIVNMMVSLLRLLLRNEARSMAVCQVIQQNLKAIGVEVKLVPRD